MYVDIVISNIFHLKKHFFFSFLLFTHSDSVIDLMTYLLLSMYSFSEIEEYRKL